MIKLIIFDYDGVIVDSFKNIYEVYKIVGKELKVKNFPDSMEEFKKIYGYTYKECHKNLGISSLRQIDKAHKIFKREVLKQEHNLFFGIEETLKELKKKYELILISANYQDEVLDKLKKYNLSKYFSEIRGQELRKYIKKPEIIKEERSRYKLTSKEIVYIGDRDVDMDAGKEAGLENIILVDYGWGHSYGNSDINSPKDLLGAIEKIEND